MLDLNNTCGGAVSPCPEWIIHNYSGMAGCLCIGFKGTCPTHSVKMLQDITALPVVEYSEDLIVFLTILFRFIHSF